MSRRPRPRFSVILRPLAAEDIRSIEEYIAQESVQNARLVVERLLRAMDRLATMPRVGKRAEESHELGFEVRQVVSDSYRILYMVRGREVHILTVRHMSRDRWRPSQS